MKQLTVNLWFDPGHVITDDITLSVEGCKECTGDGEWKVEIKFKWDF